MSLTQRDPNLDDWYGTYIRFIRTGRSTTGKTFIWIVYTLEGDVGLGIVKWFPQWRKYGFFPLTDTVFEQTCLTEIVEFLDLQKKARGIARRTGSAIEAHRRDPAR
jgi:hypothetical protein